MRTASYISVGLSMLLAATASGAGHTELERYFVGRQVMVEIDMPATKDGIDVYPERGGWLDNDRYIDRLKDHGVAIVSGQVETITKVKVKGRHIEVQLGGGGYGTFGDESPVEVLFVEDVLVRVETF